MEYRGYTYPACSQCTIGWFTWTPGSAPDFYINRREDSDTSYYSESVWTGSNYGFFAGSYGGGEPYIGGGRWTENVTWKVTPVPEPQTWLMLGAGLLAVGAAARRRQGR
ncbi:MAG: PEP-CTERM sorting domain-containing protein [Gammaproteobacteria bacterium]